MCTALAYVARHGRPNSPRDLLHHSCAVVRENQNDATLWSYGAVIKLWVVAGLGAMVRSEWDVAEELRAGSLEELLPDWTLPSIDIVAVFRSRGARVRRTARFVQLLRAAMRQPS